MSKNMPKAGGHRKPNAAARQAPEGYEGMTHKCPTCGQVVKGDASSAKSMALRRV